MSCFKTGSYLRLVLAGSKDDFGVILQIHIFHNVMHLMFHLFHFIVGKEAFDDKIAICLVLK